MRHDNGAYSRKSSTPDVVCRAFERSPVMDAWNLSALAYVYMTLFGSMRVTLWAFYSQDWAS